MKYQLLRFQFEYDEFLIAINDKVMFKKGSKEAETIYWFEPGAYEFDECASMEEYCRWHRIEAYDNSNVKNDLIDNEICEVVETIEGNEAVVALAKALLE